MNLCEIDKLIIEIRNLIPRGNTKNIILNSCMKIRSYVENFMVKDDVSKDFALFDKYFYNDFFIEWCNEISLYTIDDPHESFLDLFKDFRFAAHRSISECYYFKDHPDFIPNLSPQQIFELN